MKEALVENGVVITYPYSEWEFRRDFPNRGIPVGATTGQKQEAGLYYVHDTAAPAIDIDEELVEGWPVLSNGQVSQVWQVNQLSEPQLQAKLATMRASIWASIKGIRDGKTQAGGYQAAGKWFHSDTFSRTQQIGLVMMGANIPAGLQWKTMDGSFVTMTQALAGQVFTAAATQDAALFAYAEQMNALVLAAEDPAAVDINAGWPAVFGG